MLFIESVFAIIGRLVVILVVVVIFAELPSSPILRTYARFHRDPLVPRIAPRTTTRSGAANFGRSRAPFGRGRVPTPLAGLNVVR
jgi:hypothetical protein